MLFLWDLVVARLDTDNSFLNCWSDVKEGRTDWLRLRCKAALRRVVSDILLDIPNPGLLLRTDVLLPSVEVDELLPVIEVERGNSGRNGLVGVGGGLVWAPLFTKSDRRGLRGG
jgi:hypothetical protein